MDTLFSFLSLNNLVAIATIISGFAAAISSYLALQALVEVRKQRETTYQPELVLSGGIVYIYTRFTPDGKFPQAIPWEYSYELRDQDYHTNDYSIPSLPIYIHNIGLGTAKNVKISCTFNIDEWISIFTELTKTVEGEQPFIIERTSSDAIIMKSASYVGVGSTILPNPLSLSITHVLPASIEKVPYLYPFPSIVLYFVSIFTYITFRSQNSKIRYTIPYPLPSIGIKIEYTDIANKPLEKNFLVRIGMSNSVLPLGFSITNLTTEEVQ